MIKTLFRPKRIRNGKRVVSRLYSLKLRLDGELKISTIPLGVSDRQVAEEKARKLVQEREKELHGLLAPRTEREAAQMSLSKHVSDFVRDLSAKGRNGQYIDALENKLKRLVADCGWQSVKNITADSFATWRASHPKSPKTLNEYLGAAKGFLNWMVQHGRLVGNPLAMVQKVETRGREVRPRRAYSDDEMKTLLAVAGKYRLPCLAAALTGIRHGELKRLRWGDFNLSAEHASVTVRASVSKNHKLACLPLHSVLLEELLRFRPANVNAGDLVFPDLLPRSDVFCDLVKKAGIAKVDSQGRFVDFHSLRHTFCTNLHRAGVPQRETQELMRHNDPRLTANTYADASLFSLREAVAKLRWMGGKDDAQIDAQKFGASGLLPSLSDTVGDEGKSEKSHVNMVLKSLSGTLSHGVAKNEEWCAVEVSNL